MMKKFCNKLKSRSPTIFGHSFGKSETCDTISELSAPVTGSYDFEEAQKTFDRTYAKGNHLEVMEVVQDMDSTDSERYEDARTSLPEPEEQENEEIEYDVPRISFSFFETVAAGGSDVDALYENAVVNNNEEGSGTHKSELVIVLKEPEMEEVEEFQTEPAVEEKTFEVCVTKCLEDFPMQQSTFMKCGSDPNVFKLDEEEQENFYKVPRQLNSKRFSQSLHDFNLDAIETVETTVISEKSQESIEHISCSQLSLKTNEAIEKKLTLAPSESLDYCKTRSKLPHKFRRVTLLRKPRAKAADTWSTLKTKFNTIMNEQAAQQRVGAFDGKESTSPVKIEEFYKNSKDKCRKVLRNTGKLFKKNKQGQEDEKTSETSSQIVTNHAFFAKVNLKASDIEYKLNYDNSPECKVNGANEEGENGANICEIQQPRVLTRTVSGDEKHEEFDFTTIKSAFRRSRVYQEGQNGFEDLRRYIKQGGDFCKELAVILQERSEAETQYAKSLSKLSTKLSKACRDGVGDLNEAWRAVAVELEARAEAHRAVGVALLEDAARPLRSVTENQHRLRKQTETSADKAARNLADWRAAEAKSKKHSHACARDNEKLQDAMLETKYGKLTLSRSTSLIHLSHTHNKTNGDKENAKMEVKKRKAENAVKKADIEYYTLCVRAERARLEWESAVLRGADTFQTLEEERLNSLKSVLVAYLKLSGDICPRLQEAADRLRDPINQAEPTRDLCTFTSLRQQSQQISEQLLPDFYCEHITLAMNKERRKQALVKLIHLIRQDIERERKSKNGLENLSKAIKDNPSFGVDNSHQSVQEKLYHMKSMLTYLEGARYKVQNALAELDSRPRNGHPLAPHITITRDKTGLQQSILKVPQWLRDGWLETETSPVSEKSDKSNCHFNDSEIQETEWTDRGAADGNSNQPDSDFDEFSSQSSEERTNDENAMEPIAKCRALYMYHPNLADELTLKPGDVISVYKQQEDGWWLGECNGAVGIFPATYVETISPN